MLLYIITTDWTRQKSKPPQKRTWAPITIASITSAISAFPKKVSKRIMIYLNQPKEYSDT